MPSSYQMTDEAPPHIQIDLGRPAFKWPKLPKCSPYRLGSFFFLGTGLLFLALGTYYQVAECSRYPNWTNVWCNTTSFRTVPTPFAGVIGLVTATYLDGTCKTPEFQAFACTDLKNLGNCLTANQMNFGTPGLLWPCFLEYGTNCSGGGLGPVPVIDPPQIDQLPGCVKRSAFFVTGGSVLLFVFLPFVLICKNDPYLAPRK